MGLWIRSQLLLTITPCEKEEEFCKHGKNVKKINQGIGRFDQIVYII